jgi:hypothetical protein
VKSSRIATLFCGVVDARNYNCVSSVFGSSFLQALNNIENAIKPDNKYVTFFIMIK